MRRVGMEGETVLLEILPHWLESYISLMLCGFWGKLVTSRRDHLVRVH